MSGSETERPVRSGCAGSSSLSLIHSNTIPSAEESTNHRPRFPRFPWESNSVRGPAALMNMTSRDPRLDCLAANRKFYCNFEEAEHFSGRAAPYAKYFSVGIIDAKLAVQPEIYRSVKNAFGLRNFLFKAWHLRRDGKPACGAQTFYNSAFKAYHH